MRSIRAFETVLTVILLTTFVQLSVPTISGQTVGERRTSLREAVQPFVDRGELGGTVMLVASRTKVLDVETAGYWDLKTKQPQRPDAIFYVASETKSITGTALMILVDEGKVNVDDPVEKYLPEFRGQKIWKSAEKKEVTEPTRVLRIRHLLTHTNGMGNEVFGRVRNDPDTRRHTLQNLAQEYAKSPLEFEPGTKSMYSNAGFDIAARIIEVVSGMPYRDFLKRRVFDPLGMKDTTFYPDRDQSPRQTPFFGRRVVKGELVRGKPSPESREPSLGIPASPRPFPSPSSDLFSTAADMGRYGMLFLNGGVLDGKRFLKKSTVKMMMANQVGPSIKEKIGFAWFQDEHHPDTRNWTGGASGVKLLLDHKQGLVMVWMVQHGDRPREAVDAFEDAAVKLYGRSK
jgi:CubicO group peptidase (beta-lactamase class C family)